MTEREKNETFALLLQLTQSKCRIEAIHPLTEEEET
jgi:hypothetical protein